MKAGLPKLAKGWSSEFVERDGERIHFLVRGEGPLIVLAHGALGDGTQHWIESEFADAFLDHFKIAVPDARGHGQSSKSANAVFHNLEQRAADLVAVADKLGAQKAWYMGYSMGGWTVAGIAKYFPDRCHGLVIAGWDVEKGMYRSASNLGLEELNYDILVGLAREAAPQMTEWITAEIEPGLRMSINAINNLDGQAEALAFLNKPVLFWLGQDDAYHDPMSEYAKKHAIPVLSTPGDHVGAIMTHALSASYSICGYVRGLMSLKQSLPETESLV